MRRGQGEDLEMTEGVKLIISFISQFDMILTLLLSVGVRIRDIER